MVSAPFLIGDVGGSSFSNSGTYVNSEAFISGSDLRQSMFRDRQFYILGIDFLGSTFMTSSFWIKPFWFWMDTFGSNILDRPSIEQSAFSSMKRDRGIPRSTVALSSFGCCCECFSNPYYRNLVIFRVENISYVIIS